MARNKPKAKKLRLASAHKKYISAPLFAVLKKFGLKRGHRWRLNPHMRRHWRRKKLKV
ncbi:MAG: 50S ribosomal protein L39e [Candidatus Parvarchaeota archaeon]|nr:50S ribosomal protein L39e [Candidatus Jingweiarchaeum tengchongense]MCW1298224.1 50S ribosomal protein L39e [Candidatus Jingweiarchaeum tengchongense]MCW1300022.1 50S ribosomal protein L39e [Candidatus Jingweiarchaeum tengchongense]MCW1304839.1 50S ribosomal protein L39e [Candidatus Jingweiarchaeum tengchongense]MCW1305429.1 50S ribosomal protein L39e [Candidatus Jingweiarchaeum tengchongense]